MRHADRIALVTNGDQAPAEAGRGSSPVRDGALDLAPVAQLVVDRGGRVVHANQQARALFGLSRHDLGRALQDLDVSHRPVELRSAIEQACEERRAISLGSVRWDSEGDDQRRLGVAVAPVLGDRGTVLGASITFDDVTGHVRLRDELERSERELEVAYEELRSAVEQLETTNAELETMNEALQSTNDALEAIDDELRDRSSELDKAIGFLEAILTSLGTGVVVVDADQRIRIWNRGAEDLWGLRSEEARGVHLLALDIGLPVDRLAAPLRAAVSGEPLDAPIVLPSTDGRGRRIACAVTCAPLTGRDGDVSGAVLLMEEREAATDGR